jgi:phage terminase large subunit
MILAEAGYRAYGAAAELIASRSLEVLMEGPSNTGKTRAVLEKAWRYAVNYPGARILFVRQTRKSLSESVLQTWEDHVLGWGHPAISGTASREHRHSYVWPYRVRVAPDGTHYRGRSRIVLVGMDHPERVMSTEFDLICVFEATELTLKSWELLLTRVRNKHAPYQQIIADCNPADEFHWLNKRASDTHEGRPKMARLYSRHKDNPCFTSGDQDKLDRLTGARRRRLRDGEWVSEAGQIWEEYDAEVHLISAEEHFTAGGDLWLRIAGRPKDKDYVKIVRTVAAADWGFRAPGVLQVWGIDREDRLYRLAEVYRQGKQLDWWAERCVELDKSYHFLIGVGDPENAEAIEKLNDRISQTRGRPMDRIFRPADNAVLAGIDTVRWGLRDEIGQARLFFVRDALRFGRDEELWAANQPVCTEQEIPSYVWWKTEDGKPIKEKPDPSKADHGCDATRYAAMYAWKKRLGQESAKPRYQPGTMGDIMRHAEVDVEERGDRLSMARMPWDR